MLKLSELASKSGVPARTIRYYISLGLMPGPVQVGRNASYTAEHLKRILTIVQKQRDGLTLREIMRQERAQTDELPEPTNWSVLELTDGLRLSIRWDVSPRRMAQIRRLAREIMVLSRSLNREGEDRRE